jgi:hypothetical protein
MADRPHIVVKLYELLPVAGAVGGLIGWAIQHSLFGFGMLWLDGLVLAVLLVCLVLSIALLRKLAYARGRADQLVAFTAHATQHLIVCGVCGNRCASTTRSRSSPR